jgi:excisionase family DNA binding protein
MRVVIAQYTESEGDEQVMFYDEKVIAEVAERIAERVVRHIKNSDNGKVYPRLMTVKQAAEFLGRSENSVSHLIHRREIPVVRHGRSVRLDREALSRWIADDTS